MTTSEAAPNGDQAQQMGVLLITGLLSIGFLAAGGMKLIDPEEAAKNFEHFGYAAWFVTVVGSLEVAGAIGLWIPRLSGLAALGLTGLMLGAVVSHLRHDPVNDALPALIMLLLAGFVAWKRLGERSGTTAAA